MKMTYPTSRQRCSYVGYALGIILESFNRNGSREFGAVKSDSTHHFFGNAFTKSGPLRFSQFSGC